MQEAVNPPRPAGQREFRRKSPREAGYPAEKNGLLVRAPVLPAGQAGGAHEYRPAEGGGLLGGDGSSLAAASHQPLPRGKTHRQVASRFSLELALGAWLQRSKKKVSSARSKGWLGACDVGMVQSNRVIFALVMRWWCLPLI
ncbi:hypothetical protein SEVIR_9G102900v4 [Setaria viridis]|uniref:Uncharacterized protein n=1 Tax=Setaria viridis TaxID=4556 RepID=A0A4U6SU85_SETVI|nr:hypothetical protein SEVIR_9G102900v2 [Setaria viridis]